MAEIAGRMQTFTYDHDGNLTGDGIAEYQWDAENRLIRIETTYRARQWGFPHRVMEFRYDYMGRRVQKRVFDVTENREISCRRFLYDGWNLVAEYAAPNGTAIGALLRSYTWGLDIALSLSNAGGVGALLQIADHPSGKTFLPSYDGNGNVVSLTNAATGALAAVYEFSPYGEPLRSQTFDAVVIDNPFRFSTKFTDIETGLVYYGHRFYDPKNGRFINKDPAEEAGGLNLYRFCGNNPINRWDVHGRNSPGEGDVPVDDEWNPPLVGCREDDPVTVSPGAGTATPTPTPSDPVYTSGTPSDPGYMGDYGSEVLDPFAMTLVVDGMVSGTVGSSDVAAYSQMANDITQQNEAQRQADTAANIAAVNAGFGDKLGEVFGQIASNNANAMNDLLGAGISDMVGSNVAKGDLIASGMSSSVNSFSNITLTVPGITGTSITIGDFQSSAPTSLPPVERLNATDSAASMAAIPRGSGVNSDWAAVYDSLVDNAPAMALAAKTAPYVTAAVIGGPPVLLGLGTVGVVGTAGFKSLVAAAGAQGAGGAGGLTGAIYTVAAGGGGINGTVTVASGAAATGVLATRGSNFILHNLPAINSGTLRVANFVENLFPGPPPTTVAGGLGSVAGIVNEWIGNPLGLPPGP
ncbi:MAG: RHS repeat-associated core domain-containing protein [Opitutaceae bacterium]|nr:RHS repeat-associated core domain-containing protein [Opitutaceae bacterium]